MLMGGRVGAGGSVRSVCERVGVEGSCDQCASGLVSGVRAVNERPHRCSGIVSSVGGNGRVRTPRVRRAIQGCGSRLEEGSRSVVGLGPVVIGFVRVIHTLTAVVIP